MIKIVSMLKRNPSLSHEEFVRQWKERHAPIVRRCLPGLRKYVINVVVPDPGAPKSEWDGVVELHFESVEAKELAYASDVWLSAERRDSTSRLIDESSIVSALVEEYVVPLDET